MILAYDFDLNGEISFIEGMRLLAGAPTSLLEEEEIERPSSWTDVTAGKALAELLAKLRNPSACAIECCDKEATVTLRPYQR